MRVFTPLLGCLARPLTTIIHWAEPYPMLIHWAELNPILIPWTELYPMLVHWPIRYINSLNRAIPSLSTLRNYTLSYYIAELFPILIPWADLYPILLHWAEPYLNILPPAANRNRAQKTLNFVSQSKLSITSPESSQPRCKTPLGSRLAIAYHNT